MERTESEIDRIVTAQADDDAAWTEPICAAPGEPTNRVRLLEAGVRRTKYRLREFEATHGMTTQDLIHRFENDELDETSEAAEWIGEYRLLQRLNEKIKALRKVGLTS
jgi:hypothetical protein